MSPNNHVLIMIKYVKITRKAKEHISRNLVISEKCVRLLTWRIRGITIVLIIIMTTRFKIPDNIYKMSCINCVSYFRAQSQDSGYREKFTTKRAKKKRRFTLNNEVFLLKILSETNERISNKSFLSSFNRSLTHLDFLSLFPQFSLYFLLHTNQFTSSSYQFYILIKNKKKNTSLWITISF